MDIVLDWPPPMPGPPDYLTAIGAFSLIFNEAEMALWSFFKWHFANEKVRDGLFEKLNNRDRVDLIRSLFEAEEDEPFMEAMNHGLTCFDIICDNRNIIMHAFPYDDDLTETPRLLKRKRNQPGMMSTFHVPVEDVQQSAVAAYNTKWLFFGLASYLTERAEFLATYKGRHPWLPPLPPKPRTLSLYRPPEAPEGDQPPL